MQDRGALAIMFLLFKVIISDHELLVYFEEHNTLRRLHAIQNNISLHGKLFRIRRNNLINAPTINMKIMSQHTSLSVIMPKSKLVIFAKN